MTKRRIGAVLFGIATVVAIGYTVYKALRGSEIGFNDIAIIGMLMTIFLSSVTWGTSSADGITPEEELGKEITEKSSKVSYYLLLLFIFVVVAAEQWLTGTISISMLIVLALAMITLPFVQFLVARKYEN